jgi:hypothetical protein
VVEKMPEQGERSRKKYAYISILITSIVAITLVVIFELGYYNLTSVRETWAVTTHYPNGTTIATYNTWQHGGRSGAQLHFGRQLTIEETNSWSAGGPVTLKSVVCNTTGFSILNISPTLPLVVPQESEGVPSNFTVELTFNMPSAPYTGSLDYVFYFDYYP